MQFQLALWVKQIYTCSVEKRRKYRLLTGSTLVQLYGINLRLHKPTVNQHKLLHGSTTFSASMKSNHLSTAYRKRAWRGWSLKPLQGREVTTEDHRVRATHLIEAYLRNVPIRRKGPQSPSIPLKTKTRSIPTPNTKWYYTNNNHNTTASPPPLPQRHIQTRIKMCYHVQLSRKWR